jgi:hypothetical protein
MDIITDLEKFANKKLKMRKIVDAFWIKEEIYKGED